MLFKNLFAKKQKQSNTGLLIELFRIENKISQPLFEYEVNRSGLGNHYSVKVLLTQNELKLVKDAVVKVRESLDPDMVKPFTFERLVELLSLEATNYTASVFNVERSKRISELVAYESVGLSRIFAIAMDDNVTEIFCDSDITPLYLDHAVAGRCGTDIILTERERDALETHLETFGGYSLNYVTPSLKHDISFSGKRLRVSIDLEPLAVNRFALDIRRLDLKHFDLKQLISMDVISLEAAAFLLAWIELNGNVAIIGETSTGKTTLMNALDREINPELRRIYIEDAVETQDLLNQGYRQLKLRVEPYDKEVTSRTKGAESVKILHRSPDILFMTEVQSEEHSKALFAALQSGVRGIQTFHSSSVEQAIKRWTLVHTIPKESISELGLIVQMARPERLKARRIVSRISQISNSDGSLIVIDIFVRKGEIIEKSCSFDTLIPPPGKTVEQLIEKITEKKKQLSRMVEKGIEIRSKLQ